jgi:septal ring factor EnvC (AmiA/AmiB activator)
MQKPLFLLGLSFIYSYIYALEINTLHTEESVTISKKELEKLIAERDELKRQLNELKRMIFGSKSERFIPAIQEQLSLFEDLIEKTEKELEKHTIVYQREKAKKQKSKKNNRFAALFQHIYQELNKS